MTSPDPADMDPGQKDATHGIEPYRPSEKTNARGQQHTTHKHRMSFYIVQVHFAKVEYMGSEVAIVCQHSDHPQ